MNTQTSFPPIVLTDDEREKLLVRLGGPERVLTLEKSEFLTQTGCRPEECEIWLRGSWIQYDIAKVLRGSQRVGPWPMLLVQLVEDQVALRLFSPTKELVSRDAEQERFALTRDGIAARNWAEVAEEIIRSVCDLTAVCTARKLPTVEVMQIWIALLPAIQALVELRTGPCTEQMRRLGASMTAFAEAWRQRGTDQSPQGKYAEAGLNARRALGENHNRVLDDFPGLVEVCRTVCSQEAAQYVRDEAHLPDDEYLDALGMMAHDGANPAEVANPPARVRYALERAQQQQAILDRERWMPPTAGQTSGLQDSHDIESSAIARIDWERGKRDLGLPGDQTRAVEARIEGLSLQSSEARDFLAWEADRVEAVRRSLEPDRNWGKKLRRRFSAYDSRRGGRGRS
jgi:hypothetical protein